MKILYSLGKRHSANFQALDFLQSSQQFEIKIAAHVSCIDGYINQVDWNLDALKYDKKVISTIYAGIESFEPDLVIIDGEPIIAKLAHMLNVPIWSISALHLIDGVYLENGQKSKYKHAVSSTRDLLSDINPVRKFVYSPFGDLDAEPALKDSYEWISPSLPCSIINKRAAILTDSVRKPKLARILSHTDCKFEICTPNQVSTNSIVLSMGESAIISNALENNNYIIVVPNVMDAEAVFNAVLINEYGLGIDFGQIEHMDRYAIQLLNNVKSSLSEVKFKRKNKKIEDILKEEKNARSI